MRTTAEIDHKIPCVTYVDIYFTDVLENNLSCALYNIEKDSPFRRQTVKILATDAGKYLFSPAGDPSLISQTAKGRRPAAAYEQQHATNSTQQQKKYKNCNKITQKNKRTWKRTRRQTREHDVHHGHPSIPYTTRRPSNLVLARHSLHHTHHPRVLLGRDAVVVSSNTTLRAVARRLANA